MSLKDKFDEKTKPTIISSIKKSHDRDDYIIELAVKVKVNVASDVDLSDSMYIRKSGSNPIRFGAVDGNFTIKSNKLQELDNMPVSVGKEFDCSYNQLMTLKGCPKEVGDMDCSTNKLVSLEGLPKIKEDLYCNDNKLISLKGAPKELRRLDASDNNISSLEGIPNKASEIILTSNKISSLIGIGKMINRCVHIDFSENMIKEGGIGLLLIEGLESIGHKNCGSFTLAGSIINKYLEDGTSGLLECQEELIDAGLEEFAKL